jgi:lipopolysaccharide transport system ATP-binding protein
MTDIAIRVENLSKKYHIGRAQERYDTLRDALSASFRNMKDSIFNRDNAQRDETLWALRDVSFEVERGEVVGVIGRNGAGKSTLLKILSQITEPTEGRAVINGRVGSLLEVGTGFHPELTGRENIYLNGAILGMRREEIDRKFDEIVEFSGVEKFIDTPVKRYSSGMRVRLAFAVAAHLDPEILLVDEVLAVGDAGFQEKCLGKMEEVSNQGRTVVFVSHNMGAIRSLCGRGIMLSSGSILFNGSVDSLVEKYLATVDKTVSESGQVSWELEKAPGTKGFSLERVTVTNCDKKSKAVFSPAEPVYIHVRYKLSQDFRGMRLVVQLRTSTGEIAFTSTDHQDRTPEICTKGRYSSICHIPGELLNLGKYSVKIWAGIPGYRYLLEPIDVLQFSIQGIGNHGSTYVDYARWPGAVCPSLEWEIRKK